MAQAAQARQAFHDREFHAVPWWEKGVIYQIYPRSFQDTDGNGIGDLPGITGRLDYLQWLGVDAVWISPIYPSPMADFGYDISDYCAIHPDFGTMADFNRLLDAAHQRGMKIILDFVPNHTSDQHPWFLESRSSRDNPKRDWYLWRDPKPDGSPPNNWLSVFGGSGWELDEKTGQYYYHAFLKEQPDLNWRNPEVREAMFDVLRFWFQRGVDGFRIDVLWHMIKDAQFRDNPPNPDWVPAEGPYNSLLPIYSTDRPEVHDIAAEMRALADSFGSRVLIGEIYLPIDRLVTYYGANGDGVHMPFNFQLINLPWRAASIRPTVDAYEAALPDGGWPNWVLGNHDKHRIASRVGPAQARVAAMLLLTLRGTPTMYYGDEIGMLDVPIPPEKVQDPYEKNVPGLGLGRDPARTPMQWDTTYNGGFCNGTPWLPLSDYYQLLNVEIERDNPHSMLSLYRSLIDLRRREPAFSIGEFVGLDAEGDLFPYVRRHGSKRFLVVLNLDHAPQVYQSPAMNGEVILSTLPGRQGEPVTGAAALRPNEGLVVELK
jgi:alpha-glucosidase